MIGGDCSLGGCGEHGGEEIGGEVIDELPLSLMPEDTPESGESSKAPRLAGLWSTTMLSTGVTASRLHLE